MNLKQLRSGHRPQYITVNGKVEVVIRDAVSYQAQIDKIEELETLLSIQQGLEDVVNKCVKPLEDIIKGIKSRHENI